MTRRWGILGIVAVASILALGGCVAAPAHLTIAQGMGLCTPSEGGDTFGFGLPLSSDGSDAVRITSVGASATGVDIEGPWIVPAASGSDGAPGTGELPVFGDTFPPTSDLLDWDRRAELDGAEVAVGESVYLFWGLTLGEDATSGTLSGIVVSYSDGRGEAQAASVGSWFGLAPPPDDPALGPVCDVPLTPR